MVEGKSGPIEIGLTSPVATVLRQTCLLRIRPYLAEKNSRNMIPEESLLVIRHCKMALLISQK